MAQAARGLANFCVKRFRFVLTILLVWLVRYSPFALNLAKRVSPTLYQNTESANAAWYDDYENELATLPVPGLDPSDLRIIIRESEDFQSFADQNPELVYKFREHDIQNQDDLLRVQEVAYRALPHESYADDFACNLLRKNWESIGLDPGLLKNLQPETTAPSAYLTPRSETVR